VDRINLAEGRFLPWLALLPCRWRVNVPPKCGSTSIRVTASRPQEMALFIVVAVITIYLIVYSYFL
jgi:hypothetical protein